MSEVPVSTAARRPAGGHTPSGAPPTHTSSETHLPKRGGPPAGGRTGWKWKACGERRVDAAEHEARALGAAAAREVEGEHPAAHQPRRRQRVEERRRARHGERREREADDAVVRAVGEGGAVDGLHLAERLLRQRERADAQRVDAEPPRHAARAVADEERSPSAAAPRRRCARERAASYWRRRTHALALHRAEYTHRLDEPVSSTTDSTCGGSPTPSVPMYCVSRKLASCAKAVAPGGSEVGGTNEGDDSSGTTAAGGGREVGIFAPRRC